MTYSQNIKKNQTVGKVLNDSFTLFFTLLCMLSFIFISPNIYFTVLSFINVVWSNMQLLFFLLIVIRLSSNFTCVLALTTPYLFYLSFYLSICFFSLLLNISSILETRSLPFNFFTYFIYDMFLFSNLGKYEGYRKFLIDYFSLADVS